MRAGKKTKAWDSLRAKLKCEFTARSIESCEMCGRSYPLSFAHRLKRRKITTDEELRQVALLCMSSPDGKGCHDKLEYGPPEVMYDEITRIIESRNV